MNERINIMLQCTGVAGLVRTLVEETMREATVLGVEWDPEGCLLNSEGGTGVQEDLVMHDGWERIGPTAEDEDVPLPATDENFRAALWEAARRQGKLRGLDVKAYERWPGERKFPAAVRRQIAASYGDAFHDPASGGTFVDALPKPHHSPEEFRDEACLGGTDVREIQVLPDRSQAEAAREEILGVFGQPEGVLRGPGERTEPGRLLDKRGKPAKDHSFRCPVRAAMTPRSARLPREAICTCGILNCEGR